MTPTEFDKATAEWSRAKAELGRLQGHQARCIALSAFDRACRRRAAARAAAKENQ